MPRLPDVTSSTRQTLEGWVYTISLDGLEVITSGPFFHQADADRVGEHFASDPKGILDFLERK